MNDVLKTIASIFHEQDIMLTGFSVNSLDCVVLRRGRTDEEIDNCLREIKLKYVLLFSQIAVVDNDFKIRYKIVGENTYLKILEQLKTTLNL